MDTRPEVPAYGCCPICGEACATRERRPNGNDTCIKGHEYPSAEAASPYIGPRSENWFHSERFVRIPYNGAIRNFLVHVRMRDNLRECIASRRGGSTGIPFFIDFEVHSTAGLAHVLSLARDEIIRQINARSTPDVQETPEA